MPILVRLALHFLVEGKLYMCFISIKTAILEISK